MSFEPWLLLQVDRLSVNFTLTYTSSQFYQTTTVRKYRCNGQFLTTKAKMSVEGGILKKEPIRDGDKIGNSSDLTNLDIFSLLCCILVIQEKGIGSWKPDV